MAVAVRISVPQLGRQTLTPGRQHELLPEGQVIPSSGRLQSAEVEQGIVQTMLMPFGTSGEQNFVHAQFAFDLHGVSAA